MDYDDIAFLLMSRDNIDYPKAMDLIEETQYAIDSEIQNNESPNIKQILEKKLQLGIDYVWPFL